MNPYFAQALEMLYKCSFTSKIEELWSKVV